METPEKQKEVVADHLRPVKGRWANHPRPVELKCEVCDSAFVVGYARRLKARFCCFRCSQVGNGRRGGTVRGEQIKEMSQGKAYTKIKGRHAHRVIAEKMIGRPLKKGEVVHHIDGDILNNDPSNLQILPSQAEHARIHTIEAWKSGGMSQRKPRKKSNDN